MIERFAKKQMVLKITGTKKVNLSSRHYYAGTHIQGIFEFGDEISTTINLSNK